MRRTSLGFPIAKSLDFINILFTGKLLIIFRLWVFLKLRSSVSDYHLVFTGAFYVHCVLRCFSYARITGLTGTLWKLMPAYKGPGEACLNFFCSIETDALDATPPLFTTK